MSLVSSNPVSRILTRRMRFRLEDNALLKESDSRYNVRMKNDLSQACLHHRAGRALEGQSSPGNRIDAVPGQSVSAG